MKELIIFLMPKSEIFVTSLRTVRIFTRTRTVLQSTRNRTNCETQTAAGAVAVDFRFVGLGVEGDGLVARVQAGHAALAAVDTQVVVDHRELLLL